MRPLAALLTVALVACGGGKDTSTTPSAGTDPGTDGSSLDACFGPPGLVDWGYQLTPSTRTVPFTNKATAPLTLDAIDVLGDDFSLDTPLPIELGAGATTNLQFTFSPTKLDEKADLVARSNGHAIAWATLSGNRCVRGLPTAYDTDGDGVCACANDCDDTNPSIHPGAPEIAGNGIDDDCDGAVDEPDDAPDVDDDGDGFTEEDGDCDDEDASVFPGQFEALDRRDDDCDGEIDEAWATYDDDGDGFTEEGGDCDDGDPAVHPCAVAPDDTRDWDCDESLSR